MVSRIVRPIFLSLLVAIAVVGLAAGQTGPATVPSALELVRKTVAHEVAAANDTSVKHMFRSDKQNSQGKQSRFYVETRDAMAGMTIAYDDRPLNAQQLQSEEGRLAGLAGNPEQLKRKQKQEKDEEYRTLCIVKALPDAFLYEKDGVETGNALLGAPGMQLQRLKFRPNPAYKPPSHVEDVLVGMNGFLLIDPVSQRIARIDGTLFKEVSFGWGILGHLDKGGHFLVEQQNLPDGSWDISHMHLDLTGKILLFKNIAVKSDEVFTDFRRVPANMSFAEGVEMLKQEQAKVARGGTETAASGSSKSR